MGKIAQQFEAQWNFPNCIRAMDGKHIVMIQPTLGHSTSTIRERLVSCCWHLLTQITISFTLTSDVMEKLFRECTLSRSNERDLLEIPAPRKVGEDILPYVIVADDEAICIQGLDSC